MELKPVITFLVFAILTQSLCAGVIIEIKCHDDAGYVVEHGFLHHSRPRDSLVTLLSDHPDIRAIQPVFARSPDVLQQERTLAETLAGRPMPDISQYFHVYTYGFDTDTLLSGLQEHTGIERAFLLPDRAVPASFGDVTPDFSPYQEYLFDESGPKLALAWAYPGGRGDGITVALIESHINRYHEDLVHRLGAPDTVIGGIPGGVPGAMDHGTAVAGMLIAGNNGFGVTGICHNAAMRLYYTSAPELLANAIDITQATITRGDFILIQLQVPGPMHSGGDDSFGMVPVDFIPSVFDAICLATALGRCVVIPAGNGSQNLDDPVYQGAFDPALRDSGAIVVGAGRPADRSPVGYTNYGSRVNLQGWAERMNPCCQVWTTGYGNAPESPSHPDRAYTNRFSGTSSAAAMVAGAAICLQGAAQFRAPDKLTPAEIRAAMVSTGSPQTGSKHIGPLPDITAAIESIPIAGITTELNLNLYEFTAHDPFILTIETFNPREPRAVVKYIALQCLSEWFFFDCNTATFVPYIQGCPEILSQGIYKKTLLSFTWPDGQFGRVYPDDGFGFYAVHADLFTAELISNLARISFGWY